jgi:hypothetical protein
VNQGLLAQQFQMRVSRLKILWIIMVRIVRGKANIHGFSVDYLYSMVID